MSFEIKEYTKTQSFAMTRLLKMSLFLNPLGIAKVMPLMSYII